MSAHKFDTPSGIRFLRLPTVLRRTGLTRPTLDRLEHSGQFPARVRLSPRTVGWVEGAVDAWLVARASGGEAQTPLEAA